MDAILIENLSIRQQWTYGNTVLTPVTTSGTVPVGTTRGVPQATYDAYRRGCDSACADIVICTRKPDGEPAVLLSRRADHVCFGGTWWIHGGALFAYEDILGFLANKVEKECGVRATPEVLIGVYRTCAPDVIGSTLQPCYATRVDHADVVAKMGTDTSHTRVRLFTHRELNAHPREEWHWYPVHVAKIALNNMP